MGLSALLAGAGEPDMNAAKTILLLVGLALSSIGCATVTKGTESILLVEIANCGERIPCTATNKKGAWEFTAPGSVTVKKSDEPLVLRCEDEDDYVTRSVTPSRGSMIWGNAVLGGVIGAAVDGSTDAHWELPESVTLHRRFCRGKPIE